MAKSGTGNAFVSREVEQTKATWMRRMENSRDCRIWSDDGKVSLQKDGCPKHPIQSNLIEGLILDP
jgi:hypothetical protein